MKQQAGLIPQSFIEQLLIAIDLATVIGTFVPLKKSGKNYQACCPFHDEKSPSFTVSPDKQFYYCFGCGEHGNAINFLMKHQSLTFSEAVERLAANVGLKVPMHASQKEIKQKSKAKPLLSAMAFAEQFFIEKRQEQPGNREVVSYLHQRNLTQPTIDAFNLGYAPSGWDALLQALSHRKIDLHSALESGLIVQKNPQKHYDRFRHRLIFPIRNRRGEVIAFGGRALTKEGKPKYLNSPETVLFQKNRELYGLYEISREKASPTKILVVEGYLDVLMLWQNGIRNAVATLGTATSSGHLEVLFKWVDEIIFCFDGDAAGRKAANRALETSIPLIRDGREVRFLFLPEGEDPDSLVQQEGRAAFEARIETAQSMPDFLCSIAGQSLDLSQMEHQARFVRNIAPLINQLPMGVYRELIINKIAEQTHLQRELVLHHIEQSNQPPSSKAYHSPSHPERAAVEAEPPPHLMADFEPTQSAQPLSAMPSNNRSRQRARFFSAPTLPSIPKPSLTDDTIKLLLQKPELAQSCDLPEELQSLQLENMDLLLELITALRKDASGSSAYLFGRWHGSTKGDQLARIAAQEQVIYPCDEDYQQAYKDALKQLQRTYFEQELEKALNSPNPSPQLIKSIVERQQLIAEN